MAEALRPQRRLPALAHPRDQSRHGEREVLQGGRSALAAPQRHRVGDLEPLGVRAEAEERADVGHRPVGAAVDEQVVVRPPDVIGEQQPLPVHAREERVEKPRAAGFGRVPER